LINSLKIPKNGVEGTREVYMEEQRRLDEVTEKRDSLRAEVDRVKGRLEGAIQEKERIEEECRGMKLDPEKLGSVIEKLEETYNISLAKVEAAVVEADIKMKPFRGSTDDESSSD